MKSSICPDFGFHIEVKHRQRAVRGCDYHRSLLFKGKGLYTTYCVRAFSVWPAWKNEVHMRVIQYLKISRRYDQWQTPINYQHSYRLGYHRFLSKADSTEMLELHVILKVFICCRYPQLEPRLSETEINRIFRDERLNISSWILPSLLII